MLGNVVGLTVFGIVWNYDGVAAPHLCAPLMGSTPSYGERGLFFPPRARPRSRADGPSAARQMFPAEEVKPLPRPPRPRRGLGSSPGAAPGSTSAEGAGTVSCACVPCRFPMCCGVR